MNKIEHEMANHLNSENPENSKKIVTDSTIGSPSKDVLSRVDNEIKKFNKTIGDLEKRKQELIRNIQLNEKKMNA